MYKNFTHKRLYTKVSLQAILQTKHRNIVLRRDVSANKSFDMYADVPTLHGYRWFCTQQVLPHIFLHTDVWHANVFTQNNFYKHIFFSAQQIFTRRCFDGHICFWQTKVYTHKRFAPRRLYRRIGFAWFCMQKAWTPRCSCTHMF